MVHLVTVVCLQWSSSQSTFSRLCALRWSSSRSTMSRCRLSIQSQANLCQCPIPSNFMQAVDPIPSKLGESNRSEGVYPYYKDEQWEDERAKTVHGVVSELLSIPTCHGCVPCGGALHGEPSHGRVPCGGANHGVPCHGCVPCGGAHHGVPCHSCVPCRRACHGVPCHGRVPCGGAHHGVPCHGCVPCGGARHGAPCHGCVPAVELVTKYLLKVVCIAVEHVTVYLITAVCFAVDLVTVYLLVTVVCIAVELVTAYLVTVVCPAVELVAEYHVEVQAVDPIPSKFMPVSYPKRGIIPSKFMPVSVYPIPSNFVQAVDPHDEEMMMPCSYSAALKRVLRFGPGQALVELVTFGL